MSNPLGGFNLSTAKSSMPVIADGHTCHTRFANLKKQTTEKGDVLLLEVHLLDPVPTVDGGQIKPGFPLFERLYCYSKDTPAGQWPESTITKLCKRIDAYLGTGDPGNKKEKPARPSIDPTTEEGIAELGSLLIGKEAFTKVKAKTGDYEGNEVSSTMFPADYEALTKP